MILDDWEPEKLNADQRRGLMEIVEKRYQDASTLMTSQLPVDKWHDVISEPTFADAILDRIVHNAYRLELDGPVNAKNNGRYRLIIQSKLTSNLQRRWV
ncbi:ATP-binding protein [Magnetospira thiophila]